MDRRLVHTSTGSTRLCPLSICEHATSPSMSQPNVSGVPWIGQIETLVRKAEMTEASEGVHSVGPLSPSEEGQILPSGYLTDYISGLPV